MTQFSDADIERMKQELAVNGYRTLLRLVVLHDKHLRTESEARRDLGVFCSASGSTMKSWESKGIRGVCVARAVEFAECYGVKMGSHQLQPTTDIALQWLNYEYGLAQEGKRRVKS
ncbi:TPA: hypothetical protein ACX6RS_002545 [Photobacterium damselae]|uniref:hypothetical protein n=1 Tax=Photobacterium damselae TaxID=38293 RepID=UPI0029AF11CD|nr:hypothetical protein [Photobacterium damselae]